MAGEVPNVTGGAERRSPQIDSYPPSGDRPIGQPSGHDRARRAPRWGSWAATLLLLCLMLGAAFLSFG